MSFDPLMKALKDNPALAEELRNAKTPRERHAILDAHGIEKPGLDSQFPEASGGLEPGFTRGVFVASEPDEGEFEG